MYRCRRTITALSGGLTSCSGLCSDFSWHSQQCQSRSSENIGAFARAIPATSLVRKAFSIVCHSRGVLPVPLKSSPRSSPPRDPRRLLDHEVIAFAIHSLFVALLAIPRTALEASRPCFASPRSSQRLSDIQQHRTNHV